MPEKIAVVGPRRGADKEVVESFVAMLHDQQPDSVLVSGGAEGVDTWAEQLWLSRGGTVWSYRVRKVHDEKFVCEKWEVGAGQSRIIELITEPSWLDWPSALRYRSMLVAEVADKVCAFAGLERMRGTEFTVFVSVQGEQKPTYLWNKDDGWEQLL